MTLSIYELIIRDIQKSYLSDNRPWVVGYSGGKDSTALVQLLYYAILNLPKESLRKHIYIVSTDTRVETPQISERIIQQLELMQNTAEEKNLPISTHLLIPKLNDTFWVNLIGRGYPSPTRNFRWCTDRLKIKPVSDFIKKTVSEYGEVLIVLGSRVTESISRGNLMNKYSIEGNKFRPHSELIRAWVYTPIENLTNNDVWVYLLQVPNPWIGDNNKLFSLYRSTNGSECPLVIDNTTQACGNSRFGCWTCTVVDKDKSIESLIDNGEENLIPLANLRNYLKNAREETGNRYKYRRNQKNEAIRNKGNGGNEIGPFKYEIRIKILALLLKAQKETGYTLIGNDELSIIQEIWNKEENNSPSKKLCIPPDIVKKLWNFIYKENSMNTEEFDYFLSKLNDEDNLLNEVCQSHNLYFELIRQLRSIEEEFSHLKRRAGLPIQMRELILSYAEKISNDNN